MGRRSRVRELAMGTVATLEQAKKFLAQIGAEALEAREWLVNPKTSIRRR